MLLGQCLHSNASKTSAPTPMRGAARSMFISHQHLVLRCLQQQQHYPDIPNQETVDVYQMKWADGGKLPPALIVATFTIFGLRNRKIPGLGAAAPSMNERLADTLEYEVERATPCQLCSPR